jgi:hypothetical protein
MSPKAMRDATTTPIGYVGVSCVQDRGDAIAVLTWKVLRVARRNRLFFGKNSMVIVASIGMFPPTPKPIEVLSLEFAVDGELGPPIMQYMKHTAP